MPRASGPRTPACWPKPPRVPNVCRVGSSSRRPAAYAARSPRRWCRPSAASPAPLFARPGQDAEWPGRLEDRSREPPLPPPHWSGRRMASGPDVTRPAQHPCITHPSRVNTEPHQHGEARSVPVRPEGNVDGGEQRYGDGEAQEEARTSDPPSERREIRRGSAQMPHRLRAPGRESPASTRQAHAQTRRSPRDGADRVRAAPTSWPRPSAGRRAERESVGRVAGDAEAAPSDQVPASGPPADGGVHTRAPARRIVPTTPIAASARLKGGQSPGPDGDEARRPPRGGNGRRGSPRPLRGRGRRPRLRRGPGPWTA